MDYSKDRFDAPNDENYPWVIALTDFSGLENEWRHDVIPRDPSVSKHLTKSEAHSKPLQHLRHG
jgi:hypothetical protein